jgi:hypothetical protein
MAAPLDVGKEVAVSNLKIGTTYYHKSTVVPYHKVTIKRVDKLNSSNMYYVITNNKTPYGVRINNKNPSDKFYLVDPEPVRKAILDVAEIHTPSMNAHPGMGPWNIVRGFVGDGIPYPKPPPPTPEIEGGYRATARDKKYLARLRAGKSIGFTMRASLKAKGLLPRANGSRRVSEKYRAQKRNVTRRRA